MILLENIIILINYVTLGKAYNLLEICYFRECVALGKHATLWEYATLGNQVTLGESATLGRYVTLGDMLL